VQGRSNFSKIFPILIVIFIGYLGFSLPLPIFPAMFLNPEKSILPIDTPQIWRNILLGILLASYPLGQFFGCPILGKLSDRHGRRPILIFSLLAIVPTYVISALAVHVKSVLMLFLSRVICGLLEGNVAIAQASIADQSSGRSDKAKYFGRIVSFASAGFIFGPLIGGQLADSNLVSWFNFATPFWLAAILVLLSFFYVFWKFEETKKKEKELHLDTKRIFTSIFIGLKNKKLRPIFQANLFLYMSLIYFFSFLPVFLHDNFSFTSSRIALVQAYISLFILVTPFFFGKFPKSWTPLKLTAACSLLFGLTLFISLFPPSPSALWITLILPSCFAAMGFTYSALIVSDRVSNEMQGEMLGINQSLQFFAEIITGITGGFLAAAFAKFPLYIGAACGAIAALILWINYGLLRKR